LTVPVSLAGAGSLTNAANKSIYIGGTTTISTLTANAVPNTVYYSSTTAAQTVKTAIYHNLVIDKTGQTASLGGIITVNNDLRVLNGTFADAGFQITGNGTGNLLVANGATLSIGAGTATTFPTNFVNIALTGSTVIYNSTAAQNVSALPSYHNLTFQGNSVKTLLGNSAINGNLLVSAGTFNLGTVPTSFSVAGTTTITGTLDFNTVSAKAVSLAGNLSGAGTLTMGSGVIHTLSLAGTTNTLGTITASTVGQIIDYTRNDGTPQMIITSGNYRVLRISANGIKSLAGTTTVASGIQVNQGTLLLNGFILNSASAINIASGSTLEVNAGGQLLATTPNVALTNNGTFRVVGTKANPAIVSASAALNYFTISQTAPSTTFEAKYYQFNYLRNGLTINNGIIHNINNFSQGAFNNCTGTQCLNLNGLDLTGFTNTVDSVTFNASAGLIYNVTRLSGTGAINFTESIGTIAGEAFDNDDSNPGTLVNWSYPARYYYSVSSGSANVTTNWQSLMGANPSVASMTSGDKIFVINNGMTMTVDGSSALDFLQLWVGDGITPGTLVVGSDNVQSKITIRELLDVKTGGSVLAGTMGTTPGPHKLYVYGNIQNAGSINLQPTSTNTADLEIIGITTLINGTSPTLNNLLIQNATNNAKLTAGCTVNILGSMTIGTGSEFQDGGFTHTVGGSWSENGTGFMSGTGTIDFNGNNQISTSGVVFNNVVVSGSNISYQGTTITNGSFKAINNTQVNTGNFNQTFNGDFEISTGSKFASASTTIFDGVNPQSLKLDGDVIFQNVNFQNSGIKNVNGNIVANGLAYIVLNSTVQGDGSGLQNHTFNAGLRVDGTCNFDGQLTFVGGNIYTGNPLNKMTLGTAKLNIYGPIGVTVTAPATSCKIIVNNDVTITYNPIVGNGYLLLNNNDSLVGQATNSFNIGPSASMYMRGLNTTFPTGFGNYNLDINSQSVYDCDGVQTVKGGIEYGIVYLRNMNDNTNNYAKTANANIIVNNILYFGNKVTFNSAGHDINFRSNITPYVNAVTDTFTLDATLGGTVSFDAPDANQAASFGIYKFNNLKFTLDAPSSLRTKTFNSGSIISIKGDFIATNASSSFIHNILLNDNGLIPLSVANNFNLGEYCQLSTTNTDFGTNFMNRFAGTKNCDDNSTFYYALNGNQIIASGFKYGNLTFYNGTKTPAASLDINGYLFSTWAVATSIFNGNGLTHSVAGDWRLANAQYQSVLPNDTIILDGTINQTIVTNAGFRNLTIKNSAVASLAGNTIITGDLKVNSNAKLDADQYNIALSGNIDIAPTGLFTQTSGTTTFNNTITNQTITSNNNSYLGSVTITKFGALSVKALTDLNIRGNTVISNTSANAGILDITGKTVHFGGSLTVYNAPDTSFKAGGSNVIFDGTNSQQFIQSYSTLNLTFNNLYISGSTDKVWGAYYYTLPAPAPNVNGSTMVDIKGNMIIDGATLNAGGWGSYASGWGWGTNFNVWGNWNCNSSFQHTNNLYVNFIGLNQEILCPSFGNIYLGDITNSGTAVKNLNSSTSINGSIKIENGVTFNSNDHDMSVQYDWINNLGGIFNYGTTGNTITFSGAGNARIYSGIAAMPVTGKSFYNVVINKVAAGPAYNINVNQTGDLDVKNDLTILTGSLVTGLNNVWVGGNFVNTGEAISSFVQSNNTTLNLIASGGTKIFNPGNASPTYTTFTGLKFNAPGSNYVVLNDFNIQNNLDISNGYVDINGHKITVLGNNQTINVTGGGLEVDSASVIEFTPGAAANNQFLKITGGQFKLAGSAATPAILRKNGAGNFSILMNNGTLYANNYKIDGIGTKGFEITGSTVIDPVGNLSNGSFSGGYGTAGCTTCAYFYTNGYCKKCRFFNT
jgi:hypothetical protein